MFQTQSDANMNMRTAAFGSCMRQLGYEFKLM